MLIISNHIFKKKCGEFFAAVRKLRKFVSFKKEASLVKFIRSCWPFLRKGRIQLHQRIPLGGVERKQKKYESFLDAPASPEEPYVTESLTDVLLWGLGKTLVQKKRFLSGIAQMRGGEDPARIEKYTYIFIFDGRKRLSLMHTI